VASTTQLPSRRVSAKFIGGKLLTTGALAYVEPEKVLRIRRTPVAAYHASKKLLQPATCGKTLEQGAAGARRFARIQGRM
jgi:hypothetical protein